MRWRDRAPAHACRQQPISPAAVFVVDGNPGDSQRQALLVLDPDADPKSLGRKRDGAQPTQTARWSSWCVHILAYGGGGALTS